MSAATAEAGNAPTESSGLRSAGHSKNASKTSTENKIVLGVEHEATKVTTRRLLLWGAVSGLTKVATLDLHTILSSPVTYLCNGCFVTIFDLVVSTTPDPRVYYY